MLGYYATQMLEDFRFDVGFFGAASINEELEVFTPTVDKAFLKRKALQRCRKAYLVVDESKFGKTGRDKSQPSGGLYGCDHYRQVERRRPEKKQKSRMYV